MNAIVEILNTAGKAFVGFALPMLVQSGLLILMLLIADAALRRRVRAVFRYWIWMLVLVKLVLPPSLWSPVSIGRWVGDPLKAPTTALYEWDEPPTATPATEPRSIAADVLSQGVPALVTVPASPGKDSHPSSEAAIQADVGRAAADAEPVPGVAEHPPAQAPGASLRWQGLVFLSWAVVATVLLLLLLQRALFVRGLVAQADEASAAMQESLNHCRGRLGVRRGVSLKLSAVAGSPAACGLIRPVILIPQSVAPRLTAHDLHAVLLHELAHIKRGDLWVNLAQTLLQIVYFYNPLLWPANAIIRRIREQAVDEVVLVAMGDTAPQYPETLVNVAKLAFRRRPALSLRLVGVVESKSALAARIRHILAHPIPKTAKLGLLGLLAIFVIAVVLLPMAGMLDPHPVVVNDGPLDIRFIGVCPDQSGEILDGDGKKIDTMAYRWISQAAWGPGALRRDFLFELPEANEPILFFYHRLINMAGTDTRLHQSNANPLLPVMVQGRRIAAVDTQLPRVLRKSVLGLLPRKIVVRRVDVALKYFYGPPRETVVSFQGPFTEGQVLAAVQTPGAKLTVLPERAEGPSGERRAYFRLNLPFELDFGTPVLIYDTEGKRHAAWSESVSTGSGTTTVEFRDHPEYTSLSKVARVAVEKPYAVTARNIRVSYPDRPPRDHAPFLDVMAQRLGLTGMSPEQLARYQIRSPQDAIQVIDVLEGAEHIRTALQAMEFGRPRIRISDLDRTTRERIHHTAARWVESGFTSDGIRLGLMGHWPEFFDMAVEELRNDRETRHADPDSERASSYWSRSIAITLQTYWTQLDASQAQRLEQLVLIVDDSSVLNSLFWCLGTTKSQAVTDALWELAQDDRPWIWWKAIATWYSRVAPTDRAYDDLPEKMKLRLFLASGVPVDKSLETKASALLPQMLTPEVGRMASDVWDTVRHKIASGLDRKAATEVYLTCLGQMQSAMTERQWAADDGFRHSAIWMVASLIKTLNVWYWTDIGSLGTEDKIDYYKVEPKNLSEFQNLVVQALQWHEGNRDVEPLEPTLQGKVVDTAGKPLAMAKLSLTRRENYIDERGNHNQRDVDAGHYQTDANGGFVFRNLGNTDYHELAIEAEGFAARGIDVTRLPDGRFRIGEGTDNTIVMEKPASLSGRAIAPDGRPLVNAEVQLVRYPADRDFSARARTDAEGRFTAGSLISGSYLVLYHEPGPAAERGGYEAVRAFQVVPIEEGQAVGDVVLDLRDSTCSLEFEIVDRNDQPTGAYSVVLEVPLSSNSRSGAKIASGHEIPAARVHRIDSLPPMDGFLSVYGRQGRNRVEAQLRPNQTTRCRVRFEDIVGGDAPVESGQSAARPASGESLRALEGGLAVQDASLDSDGDGLPDFQEVHKYLTDPAKKDSDGDGTPDGDWSERREYAYSVRTVLRYLPPVGEKALDDDFQDGRILKRTNEYVEVEVIHYPLATGYDAIPENRNWRQDDAKMSEFLAPGVATNWDERMKRDLSAALKADGIDVETLTDKQVVERVASWLMKRSRSLDNVFTTYYVDYPRGTPRVYPGLEDAFRQEFHRDSRNYDWAIEQHFDHELLGKGMFYNKTHGSCTSTAVYLTTALRALGIPTRMILVTPAVDASDRRQVLMVKDAITHNRVRLTMLAGLGSSGHGFTNHTLNEVYVGSRWRRLDSSQLGCPAFGPQRFGLQTRLYTFNDLSDVNFAPTWGWRYAKGERNDTFQHDNPYSAVEVSESFGAHGNIPNPPFRAQDVRPHPQPDVFLFYPSRADVWQEFIDRVASGTANKTGRPHQKEFYDNIFDGVWLVRPQDILVLLFSLDTEDRVPEGYEDLLPRPWPEIESRLKRGETVELNGRARGMNVIVLAAPTSDGLKPLVQNSKLLSALGRTAEPSAGASPETAQIPPAVGSVVRLNNGATVERSHSVSPM